MSKTRRVKSGKFSDLLGARLWPWNEFALAQTVEGMLIPDFTRGFDGAHDGRKILIRAEIVAIDHSGILKVIAGQADGTFAGGLHKSWRDCERVRRRRSKACSYFGRNHWQLMKHETDVCVTRRSARQVSLCLNRVAVGRPIRHLAFVLEHDAGQEHMILQILANAGQVLGDVDSKA